IYIMLNKPQGIICTAAKDVPENIIDYVNYPERIFPVGRLDKHSEGLIILTNVGPIVNELLNQDYLEENDYLLTVNQLIKKQFINELSKGMSIYYTYVKENTITNPCVVKQINDYLFNITLTQVLNIQKRRICRKFQYSVTDLKRVRFKNLYLSTLPIGE